MMKIFRPLLACAMLTSAAGSVQASLVQEIFFYFPGDGTTVSSFSSSTPPPSLLPSVTVTLPTPSGLCISPCWDIGVMPSDYDPNVHSSNWVPNSFTTGGQWNTPGDGPLVEFDPLVITAEILDEGSDEPEPFQAVITKESNFPVDPETGGENGGENDGENGGDNGGEGNEGVVGIGVFNQVVYCDPDNPSTEICEEGSAINRPVPLPSSVLLLGIGLLALTRFRAS